MLTKFSKLKIILDKISILRNDIGLSFNFSKLKLFVDKAIELNLGHLSFHRAIPTLSRGGVATTKVSSSIYYTTF